MPYDVIKQKTDWMVRHGITGQWAITTVICGGSYAIIWPLETLKNMGQVRARARVSIGARAVVVKDYYSTLARKSCCELFCRQLDSHALCSSHSDVLCFDVLRPKAGLPTAGASIGERIRHMGGFGGLYRGAGPGIVRCKNDPMNPTP